MSLQTYDINLETMSRAAAIGFRSKTGRAIAVALGEPFRSPELLWRREIPLTDPDVPETFEPYHQVIDLPWEQWTPIVQPWVERIERVAAAAIAAMVRELADGGWRAVAVGVVGSADRPLQKLGNFHIRAHAAEGILFRRVLEVGAAESRLACAGYSEKQLGPAAKELGAGVEAHLKRLGKQAGSPWRADERAAATAAWLALWTAAAKPPLS
jgi:hypothetical protein